MSCIVMIGMRRQGLGWSADEIGKARLTASAVLSPHLILRVLKVAFRFGSVNDLLVLALPEHGNNGNRREGDMKYFHDGLST